MSDWSEYYRVFVGIERVEMVDGSLSLVEHIQDVRIAAAFEKPEQAENLAAQLVMIGDRLNGVQAGSNPS